MARHQSTRRAIVFLGDVYRENNEGYFLRASRRNEEVLLHRVVWVHHNGPIPPKHDIHHKDEDRSNNDPSNLQAVTRSEHSRLHAREPTPRYCLTCGDLLVRRTFPSGNYESASMVEHRRFCNPQCFNSWQRGKPKPRRSRENREAA